jgi:hypothetical protein
MAVSQEEMQALRGHRLPGGTVTIERWENTLLCDVMGVAPAPDGLAHPAFLFHLPLRGAGITIAEMLALGKPETEEAVRAGEYDWHLHAPLEVDVPYRVSGGVARVERKRGRRAGPMDAVTFRMEMQREDDGTPVATTHMTCLFLRSQCRQDDPRTPMARP